MIDSLISLLKKIRPHDEEEILTKFGVKKNHFVLVTLHRPSNVDDRKKLSRILTLFRGLSKKIPLIFPVHPRTRRNLEAHGMQSTSISPLNLVDPLRYRDFIILEKCARFVITDSGGIQEETTFLHIPCLTLRPNTERPITISQGTNELVAIEQIREKADSILAGKWKTGVIPRRWDGKTADRIVKVLTRWEPIV